MVAGKCRIPGCPFAFTDAEHVKDAIEKVATHYGLEHRTKFLDEYRLGKFLQAYNSTVEECVSIFAGRNWSETTTRPRDIVYACQQVCRSPWNYRRETIEGIRELAQRHGTPIPDPYLNVVEEDLELDEVF